MKEAESLPPYRVLTAPQFIDQLTREGVFDELDQKNKEFMEIYDPLFVRVSGAKNAWRSYKRWYYINKKTSRVPSERFEDKEDLGDVPPSISEVFLYRVYSGFSMADSYHGIQSMLNKLTATKGIDTEDIQKSIAKDMPKFFSYDVALADVPSMKKLFSGRKAMKTGELLLEMGQYFKGKNSVIPSEVFHELTSVFISQMKKEESKFSSTRDLLWVWIRSNSFGITDDFYGNFRNLEDYSKILSAVLLLQKHATYCLEVMTSPEESQHKTVQQYLTLLYDNDSKLLGESLARGIYVRNIDGRNGYQEWIQQLMDNAEETDDPWYHHTVFEILDQFENAVPTRFFWKKNIDSIFPDIPTLPYEKTITMLAASWDERVHTYFRKTLRPEDIPCSDFGEYGFIRVRIKKKENMLYGSLGFIEPNDFSFILDGEVLTDSPKKFLAFYADLSEEDNPFVWSLIDEDELSQDQLKQLETVVVRALEMRLYEEEQKIPQVEPPSISPTREIITPQHIVSSRVKGPEKTPPKDTKRRKQSRSQTSEEEDIISEMESAYPKNIKIIFNYDEKEVEEMIQSFDTVEQKMIRNKLKNQKERGTSRIKPYPLEEGPSGRVGYVKSMRVNRHIRILAEMAEEGNIAHVYRIFRK